MDMLDIILPCYNSNLTLLARAIESIFAQVTEYEFRLWVVDDGSDTRIAPTGILSTFRITHRGLPGALNYGHLLGTAKYICWTSDDNLLSADFVQAMVSKAEEGFDFVRCLERHIPGGEIVDPRHGNSAMPVAGLYDGYLGAGHIYSRKLYERTSGYDSYLAGIEDLDEYYKLMQLNPRVGFVDQVLYTYRDHTSRFSEAQVEEARRRLIAKWRLK